MKDFLEGLVWDRISRITTWLQVYCGAASDASEAGVHFFVSSVARAYVPGHKTGPMLVLVGAQGVGKSSVARVLGSREPYGPDDLSEFSDARPRSRCVFVATANDRRFLGSDGRPLRAGPLQAVQVHQCDVEGLRSVVDQLWAEAVFHYTADETIDHESTSGHNMYGCTPCPVCTSTYRAGHRELTADRKLVVQCDDCGHTRPAREAGVS